MNITRCLSQGPARSDGLRHHCRLPLNHTGDCVHGLAERPDGLASEEAILWSPEPVTTVQVAINCLLATIARERKMREQWSHHFDTLMYALVCVPSEGVEAGVARAHGIQRERDDALWRARTAAQKLIAEIGASGPESVEETAVRAAAIIAQERGSGRHDANVHACGACGAPYYDDDGEPAFNDHAGARERTYKVRAP